MVIEKKSKRLKAAKSKLNVITSFLVRQAHTLLQQGRLVYGNKPAILRTLSGKFRRLPKITRVLAVYAFTLALIAGVFYWRISLISLAESPLAEAPFDQSAYLPEDLYDPALGLTEDPEADIPEGDTEAVSEDPPPEEVAPEAPEPEFVKGIWPVRGELFYGFHDTVMRSGLGYPLYYTSKGIAVKTASGTNVVAPWDGIIIKVSEKGKPHGQSVMIEHGHGLVSYYGALEKVAAAVGEKISRGQPFALVGSGFESEPDYLYLEITRDGKALNPLDYLAP